MFATASPAKAYAKVNIETGVQSASPHKLILMLFDGALLSISMATNHMKEKRIEAKGKEISKVIDIIGNGLKLSLDRTVDSDLVDRLEALYDYMCMRLVHANLHNDEAALREVANLLGELRGAWEEIANDPAVLSINRAAA